MAITLNQPNTIHLSGEAQEVGDLAASAAICPGMLVERFNSAGVIRVRAHATASVATARNFAVEQSEVNKNVNDGYAINDLVRSKIVAPGGTVWAIIPSGQNIVAGQKLESNGDGTLKAYATLGAALCSAIENVNNTTGSAGPGTYAAPNPPPEKNANSALPVGAARIRVEIL